MYFAESLWNDERLRCTLCAARSMSYLTSRYDEDVDGHSTPFTLRCPLWLVTGGRCFRDPVEYEITTSWGETSEHRFWVVTHCSADSRLGNIKSLDRYEASLFRDT